VINFSFAFLQEPMTTLERLKLLKRMYLLVIEILFLNCSFATSFPKGQTLRHQTLYLLLLPTHFHRKKVVFSSFPLFVCFQKNGDLHLDVEWANDRATHRCILQHQHILALLQED